MHCAKLGMSLTEDPAGNRIWLPKQLPNLSAGKPGEYKVNESRGTIVLVCCKTFAAQHGLLGQRRRQHCEQDYITRQRASRLGQFDYGSFCCLQPRSHLVHSCCQCRHASWRHICTCVTVPLQHNMRGYGCDCMHVCVSVCVCVCVCVRVCSL